MWKKAHKTEPKSSFEALNENSQQITGELQESQPSEQISQELPDAIQQTNTAVLHDHQYVLAQSRAQDSPQIYPLGCEDFANNQHTRLELVAKVPATNSSDMKETKQTEESSLNIAMLDQTPRQPAPGQQIISGSGDDHTEDLQLLRELPDYEMHLFNSSQRPDGKLDAFTCFENLPAELRCRIWQACFPGGRPVFLQPGFPNWSEDEDIIFKVTRSSPPITASINHESRLETEKHYGMLISRIPSAVGQLDESQYENIRCVLEQIRPSNDAQYKRQIIDQFVLQWPDNRLPDMFIEDPQRIWFNPQTDIAVLDMQGIVWDRSSMVHLMDLFSKNLNAVSAIRVLELKYLNDWFFWDQPHLVEMFVRSTLLFFHRLTNLRLFWYQYEATAGTLRAKAALENLFQGMERRYPWYKSPKLLFGHERRHLAEASRSGVGST